MLSLDRLASNELTMTQEGVQSALSPLGLVVEPMVNFFHAQTLAKVKAALGESAFQSAWEEGSRWPLAEAVRRAPEEEI